MFEKISGLAVYEKALLALSILFFSFLIIDPLVYSVIREFHPEALRFLRALTYLGKSYIILIPSGVLIVFFTWMRAYQISPRRYAGYGLAQQLLLFLFAAVALSGMATTLLKNIFGRARPKLYDQLGAVEFQPFSFEHDFTAFPSAHATTAGALAGVLAIIWPCARVPFLIAAAWVASTRFIIGAHFFTDAVAGCALGLAFSYFIRDRMARRGWLFRKHEDGRITLRGRVLLRSATRNVMRLGEEIAAGLFERFTLDKTPRK